MSMPFDGLEGSSAPRVFIKFNSSACVLFCPGFALIYRGLGAAKSRVAVKVGNEICAEREVNLLFGNFFALIKARSCELILPACLLTFLDSLNSITSHRAKNISLKCYKNA